MCECGGGEVSIMVGLGGVEQVGVCPEGDRAVDRTVVRGIIRDRDDCAALVVGTVNGRSWGWAVVAEEFA